MCFRPADSGMSRTCGECGMEVNAVGGFMPPKCPGCGTPFPKDDEGIAAPAAPAAPSAPAPAAPVAPSAPVAPKAKE